jgi:antitoxin (DNA-binding transcriptional repressor) of toxin-antitoxin stability system
MTERVQVNMHEAQSLLSQLAERAWGGETVVIVKDGYPDLHLRPHVDTPQARKPGRLKGKIRMFADFDKTSRDIDGFEDGLRDDCFGTAQ